jgi:hypothetical protein
MTCIYTGAVVKLPEYGTNVVCDLHEVADVIVIRFKPEDFRDSTSRALTHKAVISDGYKDKIAGVFVIPKTYIKPI